MGADDLGRWEPLSIVQVTSLFSRFRGPWWFAGGYAIELAVGRTVREPHGDVDVSVLRADHVAVHDALDGWELWAADPPGSLRPWEPGEELARQIHDVWCRPGPERPWALQVMIDEADGEEWVSRRDPSVRRPIATLIEHTPSGIPYLTPAVQLYYKAARPRDKDQIDFHAALPVLSDRERGWLHDQIKASQVDHPWLAALRRAHPASEFTTQAGPGERE